MKKILIDSLLAYSYHFKSFIIFLTLETPTEAGRFSHAHAHAHAQAGKIRVKDQVLI